METVWLICRNSGEAALVDWETVERVIGVEAGYVGWVIELDGVFENAAWRVMAVG